MLRKQLKIHSLPQNSISLAFFCTYIPTFLLKYKSDKPTVPFMYDDPVSLINNILQLVVKPNIIDGCKSAIDLKNIVI